MKVHDLAVVTLVLASACSGAERSETPPPQDETPSTPPSEVSAPGAPSTAAPSGVGTAAGVPTDSSCAEDADCEVVGAPCRPAMATTAGGAAEMRAYWARLPMPNCQRARWAPPEDSRAFCLADRCALDTVTWPALRPCEVAADCVAFRRDPCGPPIAVNRAHRREARRIIVTDERRELCAIIAASVRERSRDFLANGPRIPNCFRGYCRP